MERQPPQSGFGWYFYKHPCILTAFWSCCGGRPSEEKTRVFLGLLPNLARQCSAEADLQPYLVSCSRILVASALWLFSHAGAKGHIYQGQIVNSQRPFEKGGVFFYVFLRFFLCIHKMERFLKRFVVLEILHCHCNMVNASVLVRKDY